VQRPERQGSKLEIKGTQIHNRTIAESVAKSVCMQTTLFVGFRAFSWVMEFYPLSVSLTSPKGMGQESLTKI